jgi:hypothetical protein
MPGVRQQRPGAVRNRRTSIPPDREVRLPVMNNCGQNSRTKPLVVVIDAATLMPTDTGLHDQDDTGLPAQLGR